MHITNQQLSLGGGVSALDSRTVGPVLTPGYIMDVSPPVKNNDGRLLGITSQIVIKENNRCAQLYL